jgi:hypothetical protein
MWQGLGKARAKFIWRVFVASSTALDQHVQHLAMFGVQRLANYWSLSFHFPILARAYTISVGCFVGINPIYSLD